jgi:hypothetical protein
MTDPGPALLEVSHGRVPANAQDVTFWDPNHFVSGALHRHSNYWKDIPQASPEGWRLLGFWRQTPRVVPIRPRSNPAFYAQCKLYVQYCRAAHIDLSTGYLFVKRIRALRLVFSFLRPPPPYDVHTKNNLGIYDGKLPHSFWSGTTLVRRKKILLATLAGSPPRWSASTPRKIKFWEFRVVLLPP